MATRAHRDVLLANGRRRKIVEPRERAWGVQRAV